MSIRHLIALPAVFPSATLLAEAPLPPDINPVTLSRLPPERKPLLPALPRGR